MYATAKSWKHSRQDMSKSKKFLCPLTGLWCIFVIIKQLYCTVVSVHLHNVRIRIVYWWHVQIIDNQSLKHWLCCLFSISWGSPILDVQECQSYSHFNSCSFLLQIWTFPGSFWRPAPGWSLKELAYTRTGRTSPLYVAFLTSCGQVYGFHPRNSRVQLTLVAF